MHFHFIIEVVVIYGLAGFGRERGLPVTKDGRHCGESSKPCRNDTLASADSAVLASVFRITGILSSHPLPL